MFKRNINKKYSYKHLLFFVFIHSILITFLFAIASAGGKEPVENAKFQIADSNAFEELGEALFSDLRFSSPEGKLSGSKKDEHSQFRISCKSCHLVDESIKDKGMRGYTDFSKRTPVPYRTGDTETYPLTHRRTQQLINIAGGKFGPAASYHWDGEFSEGNEHASLIKLIEATFVSRNMGWRPGEENTANSLRLKYLLEEDLFAAGSNGNVQPSYIDRYCISLEITREQFFLLEGHEILSICNEAIAFYLKNINSDIESSFDLFLIQNGIQDPKTADENLLNDLLKRSDLKFINKTIPVPESEHITSRKVKFGKTEFEGLRLFMDKKKTNCSGCHTPPSFTDNRYHNIGVSELDYYDVHKSYPVDILDIKKIKNKFKERDLKDLKSLFQVYPSKLEPDAIDLGRGLFTSEKEDFGAFKTPALRNLKYCAPYTHSGRAKSIFDAIMLHVTTSNKLVMLPNVSGKLPPLDLTRKEILSLAAFINSLNDHYE